MNRILTELAVPAVQTTGPITAAAADQYVASVVTRMDFPDSPGKAWDEIMFYEQIEQSPPLHLRVLLPVPVRTEGRKSEVGDEVGCVYQGGHLVKRVTRVVRGREYAFAVTEQKITVGIGLRLLEGSYTLRVLPDGRTEVTLKTRYSSPRRPRWLWGVIEEAVCHSFHRYILKAMRCNLRSR